MLLPHRIANLFSFMNFVRNEFVGDGCVRDEFVRDEFIRGAIDVHQCLRLDSYSWHHSSLILLITVTPQVPIAVQRLLLTNISHLTIIMVPFNSSSLSYMPYNVNETIFQRKDYPHKASQSNPKTKSWIAYISVMTNSMYLLSFTFHILGPSFRLNGFREFLVFTSEQL